MKEGVWCSVYKGDLAPWRQYTPALGLPATELQPSMWHPFLGRDGPPSEQGAAGEATTPAWHTRPRGYLGFSLLSPSRREVPQASNSYDIVIGIPFVSLQVTLLSVEMTALKEERDRLRVTSEDKEPKEQLQKAIRDRDEAIAK